MQACEYDLYSLVSKLFNIQRQFLQWFLIDYLRVSETEQNWYFLGFYVLFYHFVYLLNVVEIIQIADRACESVEDIWDSSQGFRLIVINCHYSIYKLAFKWNAFILFSLHCTHMNWLAFALLIHVLHYYFGRGLLKKMSDVINGYESCQNKCNYGMCQYI